MGTSDLSEEAAGDSQGSWVTHSLPASGRAEKVNLLLATEASRVPCPSSQGLI